MYRGRPWTMRQYSGFGTAEATNERWKLLLAAGSTGLSCAFDLPTQMGYDSDHPRAEGEVGKVGVAIDSIDDMRLLLAGMPARPGHDVDDDQLDGGDPAAALPTGRRGAGRRRRKLWAARSRTTSSRSTWPAAPTCTRPARRCGSSPTSSRTAARTCRSGTRSRSPATTSAKRARPRCRRSRSRWPTASPTSRRRSTPGSTSTSSPRACRSSGTRTTTSSRRSPSSGPPAACGRAS